MFKTEHLNELKKCMDLQKEYRWVGNNIRDYARYLCSSGSIESEISKQICDLEAFPDSKIERLELESLIASDAEPIVKVISILAWGGMKRHQCLTSLKTYSSHWQSIIDDMLGGRLSRDEAYKAFHKLRLNGNLVGMGPAYFTKLIFFLETNHNGYIMDQWTARSMNLLRISDKNPIRLNKDYQRPKTFYVDGKKNDETTYRAFCEDLEELAERLGISPIETEMLIFSKGDEGKKATRGKWRQYVVENG